jgi:hypothetical protein
MALDMSNINILIDMFNKACYTGILYDCEQIIDILISHNNLNLALIFTTGIENACINGNIKIINFILSLSKDFTLNLNKSLSIACKNKSYLIIDLLIKYNADKCECGQSIKVHVENILLYNFNTLDIKL